MRLLWITFGLFSLLLGVIGMFLPLLPTVPLLLLAVFCFARSSERLHDWLVNHPRLGPPIRDWQRSGAISLPAKRLATASIALAFLIPYFIGVRPQILTLQAVVLSGVLIFIWTRPSA